jgi:hypothetical protein
MKIQSPCCGCSDRHFENGATCHATCEKYKKYKAEIEEIRHKGFLASAHAGYVRNLRLMIFKKTGG